MKTNTLIRRWGQYFLMEETLWVYMLSEGWMGMISLSLMKMRKERSHLPTPCVVSVNLHFRVDAWQFSILNTFRPQLSLKPPHFQDFWQHFLHIFKIFVVINRSRHGRVFPEKPFSKVDNYLFLIYSTHNYPWSLLFFHSLIIPSIFLFRYIVVQ